MNRSMICASMLALVAGAAEAAVVAHASEASFTAAAGATSLETFNAVVGEPDFRAAPLTVGDLTFTSFGFPAQHNFVDQPPHLFGFSVDGTAAVNALVFAGNTYFEIAFAAPVTAFGASFFAFQDSLIRTQVIVGGETLTPPIQPGNALSFFGVTSDVAFDRVRFVGVASDGFALDNVRYTAAAVPEPAAWSLMILGFVTLGATTRRRRMRYRE